MRYSITKIFEEINLAAKTTASSAAGGFLSPRFRIYSLWIYLIHENIIVRRLFRPAIWAWLYEHVEWSYPFAAIALFSAGLFTASLLVSIIYSATINKLVNKVIIVVYEPIRRKLAKVEKKALSVK